MGKVGKLLTLIIPAYNMERYLDRCLQSLLADPALLPLLDILMVNDGSTDATPQIGRRYQAQCPGSIRVIDKENGHYGSCVNRGLAEAKGTFVKILDADDAFCPEVLSAFLSFLSAEPVYSRADLVLSDFVHVDEDGNELARVCYPSRPGLFGPEKLLGDDVYKWFIHGLTYRTSLLREMAYQQLEGMAYTDNQWAFVPLQAVRQLAQFDGALYRYTVGRDGQSVSRESHARNLWMEVAVIASLLDAYAQIRAQLPQANRLFMDERLRRSVDNLYNLYFMVLSGQGLSRDPLRCLEGKMQALFPELYDALGEKSVRMAGITFRPVRSFRRGRLLPLAILGLLYRLADALNSFIRPITRT